MGNLRDYNYDFGATWRTAKADELRRSIKAGECYCPLANASYTNMLCHVPTLTSVGMEVAKGTAAATLTPASRGKSAKLRSLPVINAVDEARMHGGNGNGNGHKTDADIEASV